MPFECFKSSYLVRLCLSGGSPLQHRLARTQTRRGSCSPQRDSSKENLSPSLWAIRLPIMSLLTHHEPGDQTCPLYSQLYLRVILNLRPARSVKSRRGLFRSFLHLRQTIDARSCDFPLHLQIGSSPKSVLLGGLKLTPSWGKF